jgi:glycosyltransferase involved in cell wall biosynthesis
VGRIAPPRRAQSFDLWAALRESRDYLARLRARVSWYVIGDQQAFEFFTSHGVSEKQIARIPQALPQDALARRPRETSRPVTDRPLRIGFVGRLDPDKGFRVLARAYETLPQDGPAELWVVHRTLATEENVARQFSSRRRFLDLLAKGRVKLLRPESPDELYRLMARVDVGVIPSIQYEAPCLVMLEMVAQKTPIVRSESKGMEHVIQDGVNGRTFPYGDSAALAAILNDILAHPALLESWRERLPAISPDDEYAGQLKKVFDTCASAS